MTTTNRRNALPIDPLLPEIVAALIKHPAIILRAETGAGKTTRVPPAILDSPLARAGRVVMLQPRRLAAKSAAARIASERGTPLGDEIGYHVRFDRRASRQTRLLVVTEGLFVRTLQDDPFLDGVAVVIFDEFHERNLDTDLAFAMVRKVQREVRPDLKLVIMSATLDAAELTRYLDACPVLDSPGRLHPVEIRHQIHEPQHAPVDLAADAVATALGETTGHVLVFLPGRGEIRRLRERLAQRFFDRAASLHDLHGELPLEAQQAAIAPSANRKIILATNVAETSVTIDGVTAVIDTGLARVMRQDPSLGINRLHLERISLASAQQRAGRAGRTAPGVCWRLWTRRREATLAPAIEPEILRVDLSEAVLQLAYWGERDPAALPWLTPPPAEALASAAKLLERLGAIRDNTISPLGRRMASLPVHPRLARLLIDGHERGHPAETALAAALLSERDPFRANSPRQPGARPANATHESQSDLADRVETLLDVQSHRGRDPRLNPGAIRAIMQSRDQLERLLASSLGPSPAAFEPWQESLRRAIWAAFPDRLARRRGGDSSRAVMVGGRGVKLAAESAVRGGELFIAIELQDTGQSESLVHIASAVERDWLPAESLRTQTDLTFDRVARRVRALRRTYYDDLLLDESPTAIPSEADVGAVLAAGLAENFDPAQLLTDDDRRWLARLAFTRQHAPQLELPTVDAEHAAEILPTLCAGCSSWDEVRRRSLVDTLRGSLTHEQRRAIDDYAPRRYTLPNGREASIVYEPGKPPVLASRIQDFFGLADTPRVARGKVPLLLHLLGPNGRPQQITADLASFWRNGYPEVRKELKRRYPKHRWPDDPLTTDH